MRTLPALLASVLLLSCGSDEQSNANVSAGANSTAVEDARIMCALDGASRFERNCATEWTESREGRVLVLHAPDGGFRRLLLTTDGRGFIVADGAEPAKIARQDFNLLEVSIGHDRYRLPATMEENGP